MSPLEALRPGRGERQPPILALAAGDPAGIGPEILVKALAVAEVRRVCRPIVFGWTAVLREAADRLHLGMRVRAIRDLAEAQFAPDEVDVFEASPLAPGEFQSGVPSLMAGQAALDAAKAAARAALAGYVGGVVTAPMNRDVLVGGPFMGLTEAIARETGARRHTVMLTTGKLRVAHVSAHVSLREAVELVRKERVLEVIRLAHEGCMALGIPSPRIAAAGLNPHAGEGGSFGREEIEEIAPAIEAAIAEGIDASGPHPAHGVFLRCLAGDFSAVVAMYHDQGHIPSRMIDFKTGVNITLGLPIIRTSVGHGPGFDIAGQWIANPSGMVEAIRAAALMASRPVHSD